MSQCKAALNIKGEGFVCDMEAPHSGWAHANSDAGAIWCSDGEARACEKREKAHRAEEAVAP